jgi:Ran GTPase-activating protein (RanGAP) involved in mRNA processing and transport
MSTLESSLSLVAAGAEEIDVSYRNLRDDDATRLVNALLSNPSNSVRVLRLAGNQLTDGSATRLAAALASFPNLRIVDLSDNQLSDGGARALLDAATFADHVTHVYVKGNEAVAMQTVDAMATLLAPRAQRAQRAQRVRALIASITSSVSSSASTNDTNSAAVVVDEIDLGNASLDRDSLRELVAALLPSDVERPPQVHKLNLGYNGLSDDDVAVLVPLLQRATIDEILLDGNVIGDKGAIAIAEALRLNPTSVVMLDLNDNALGDAGVDALYETMLASPRLLKLYVGGNTDVTATAARRVATTVRQRAERERRAALERLKLRATSALSAQRSAQLKAIFTQYDDDADGVVKLTLLPAMYHALGHAARQEQTKELVLQLDRPSADTGLIDFATFVLVLERWQETYDQSVVVRNVWRRHAGQRAKVGIDALKAALHDMRKPLPTDNVMSKIVSEISPDDMQLNEEQFNHLLTCWDFLVKATISRRC